MYASNLPGSDENITACPFSGNPNETITVSICACVYVTCVSACAREGVLVADKFMCLLRMLFCCIYLRRDMYGIEIDR